MDNHKTSKKITMAEGGDNTSSTTVNETQPFVASKESKAKAKNFRIIAIIAWIIAIGFEIGAILMLKNVPVSTLWLIVLIAADVIFVIAGSLMWKKANRLDPASEKDKVKFFIQNQLGLIIAVIAFLPLVVLIFTNKNLSGKQKGILGTVAVVAMLIAGIAGIDFNPPSVEQYTQQTEQVKSLTNGLNHVYWTKSGKSYHLYQDCSYINTNRTVEIFQGTVAQARELKNITDLCDRCQHNAEKEKNIENK